MVFSLNNQYFTLGRPFRTLSYVQKNSKSNFKSFSTTKKTSLNIKMSLDRTLQNLKHCLRGKTSKNDSQNPRTRTDVKFHYFNGIQFILRYWALLSLINFNFTLPLYTLVNSFILIRKSLTCFFLFLDKTHILVCRCNCMLWNAS